MTAPSMTRFQPLPADRAADDVERELLARWEEEDLFRQTLRAREGAPTFVFSHGDGWTTGGDPFRVDNRAQWMAVVKAAPYASRELDRVRVEMHGDVAITYGRYVARMKGGDPGRQQFDLWFERVYAKRGGRWQYLSHRTVDGPHFSRIK